MYNLKKSHLVLFDDEGKYRNMVELKLNGEELHLQKSATHLGQGNVGQCNVTGIDKGKNDLIWRKNYVTSRFGCCSENVRSYLFRTYFTSYYGSPLWKLDSKESNNSTPHGDSASEKYGMFHTEHIVIYCVICMKDLV